MLQEQRYWSQLAGDTRGWKVPWQHLGDYSKRLQTCQLKLRKGQMPTRKRGQMRSHTTAFPEMPCQAPGVPWGMLAWLMGKAPPAPLLPCREVSVCGPLSLSILGSLKGYFVPADCTVHAGP